MPERLARRKRTGTLRPIATGARIGITPRNAAASDCIAGAAVKSEFERPNLTSEIAGFFSYPT
jgi:hypothetical protein